MCIVLHKQPHINKGFVLLSLASIEMEIQLIRLVF